MRCMIHIGTEKTGSSYLQCILALSRERLIESGVYFPLGAPFDEKCMKSGRISGGNALRMAADIEQDEWTSVGRTLAGARKRATEVGSSRVLISSELLLAPLAENGRVAKYLEVLGAAGFSDVSFLLILRDPVDQLLSLYKHRAKSGTAGDLDDWCESGYHLPQELSSFRHQIQLSEVELAVRRYDRSQGGLDRIMFEDWLGIAAPRVELPTTVNPSLSLSELKLIQQVAERKPEMAAPLYSALADVPRDQKGRSRALESHARALAAQTAAAHAAEWRAWNRRLPGDEQLRIPDAPDTIPEPPKEHALSVPQMHAVSELLCETSTLRFIASLFWHSRLRAALGRIKRNLWRPS